jgi:L-lysine 6-transaminase
MVRFKKYLEIIYEENLVENARVVGEHLISRLHELEDKYPQLVSNVRGKGLFCAIDMPTPELRGKLRDKVFANNVVILGSGVKSIRFRPSLNITKEHINEGIGAIDKSLSELR